MGLDMFIISRKPTTDTDKELAYWRKANHIHAWFVRLGGGVDDCSSIKLTKDNIKELIAICKKVQRDPSLGPSLLPTQPGFFFGSTDYDKYYMETLEETINQLNIILATHNFEDAIFYCASW
jgi:hypothetical protein